MAGEGLCEPMALEDEDFFYLAKSRHGFHRVNRWCGRLVSTAADGETFQAALDAAMRFGKGEMAFVSEKICFIRGEGRLGLGRGAVRISG